MGSTSFPRHIGKIPRRGLPDPPLDTDPTPTFMAMGSSNVSGVPHEQCDFVVTYGASLDGGRQERDAGTRFLLEVFPDAKVCQVCQGHGVKISTKDGTEIVSVSQRDMYSKYKWPAKPKIIKALEEFKAKQ